FAEHRRRAVVLVRDGRQVLVPVPRPDEIPPAWHAPDGRVLDPVTGGPAADWRVATDGRLILITPADQRSYDELAAAHAEALSEWESVA
ncbi:transcriptional regulator, partial [Streptomyces sp. NPDC048279]